MQTRSAFYVLVGLLCSLILLGSTGCATIMSDGGDDRPLLVTSEPDGATVFVKQGLGGWIQQPDPTPTTIYLDPTFGDGSFTVRLERAGYATDTTRIGTKLDPWFFGSLGLIVLFVIPGVVATGIDLATGAWKKLDRDQLYVELKPAP